MKISTRSRYGAILLVDLARHHEKGPVKVGEISKRHNISVKYLEQIILQLKKANLVSSVRGPKGGHVLAQNPEQITIAQVFKLFEIPNDSEACFCNQDECIMADACQSRLIWQNAINAFYKTLESITIADALNRCCE